MPSSLGSGSPIEVAKAEFMLTFLVGLVDLEDGDKIQKCQEPLTL